MAHTNMVVITCILRVWIFSQNAVIDLNNQIVSVYIRTSTQDSTDNL